MGDFRSLLKSEFAPYGTLSGDQLALLEQHYLLLLRWNESINLTRITSLLEAVLYHYCESLYLAERLPRVTLRIADVGSGGGFPGVPIAIYRPDCEVSLIESHQRKAVFLREATLHLPNVRVLAKRAEQVSDNYDWIVSRAVLPRDILKLNLAQNVAVLGTEGSKLPWGNARSLLQILR